MTDFRPFHPALIARFAASTRGATAVTVAFFMTSFIGLAGFVIDLGHVMYVKRELQASTDAAALAGARQINCCATSNAVATATAYSAAWSSSSTVGSNQNANSNLYVQMVSGYPQLKCFSSTNVSCSGTDNANGIVVKQTASVPMWFAKIFGLGSVPVTATATAAGTGGNTKSFDIDIILDTTASMNTTDASCSYPGNSSPSRIQCALKGLQTILTKISANADYVGVMAFPPLASTAEQADDTTCPSSNPSTTAYKNVVTAGAPTYQIVGLSHNYQTGTSGALNTSAGLVVAAGGSSCQGVEAPGGYGTFYADAIAAAQADLSANGRGGGVQKAIIIISDGDANATSSNMTAAEYHNQCTEAVTAAQAATAAGTKVFTIAYGSPTSGCSTDTGASATNPCATMQAMASESDMFYSDDASGCSSPKQTLTGLIAMMGSLAQQFFTAPRLIPDNTT